MANKLINSISAGGADVGVFGLPYGECSTDAATAVKEVTVQGDFALEKGAMVVVKFLNSNSVSSNEDDTLAAQLNVNGSGAKPIKRYGTTDISSGTTTSGWTAGAVLLLTYDGNNWIETYWSNTTYTPQSLGIGYGYCTTAEATTAKTVSISSYSLTKNGCVGIRFQYAVPASSTLNINSKGAKSIYYRGAKITAGIIKAGDSGVFYYDGSYYHLIAMDVYHHTHSATFTGTAASHNHSIPALTTGGPSGTAKAGSETHTHSIPALSFSGTAFSHSHDIPMLGFSGTAASHTHSIPALTFSGTAASHNHSIPQLLFSGTQAGHLHTIPQLLFSGTQAGHSHTLSSGSGTAAATTTTAVSAAAQGHTHSVSCTGSVSNQRLTLGGTATATTTTAVSAAAQGHIHSVTLSGNTGSTNITPAGTITAGSGTSIGNTGITDITPAGTISAGTGTSVGNTGNKSITPAGSIAANTTGSASITPAGTIAVIDGDAIGTTSEVTYTPAGSIAANTTGTPSATVTIASSNHTHSTTATNTGDKSVTPAGTVAVTAV